MSDTVTLNVMKTLLFALLGLLTATFTLAQPPVEVETRKRTPEDLRKLLAPIALYPDALVALILPACTNPADVVLAARFLAAEQDLKEIENQTWDESVKSLVRYPEVIKWMDENLVWATEVGEAFAAQPADLMNTVQVLRTEAQAAGLLTDTPQQTVVVREQEISIQPAQEDVIYVPYYDPEVLIVHRPVFGPWMTFGVGFAVGTWLNYDCDWRSRRVVVGGGHPGWRYRPDWRWHDRHHVGHFHREWRPSERYWRHVHNRSHREYRPVQGVVRPRHHVESPSSHRGDDRRRSDGRRDDYRNDQRNWSRTRDGRQVDGQAVRPENFSNLPTDRARDGSERTQERRGNGDRRGRNSSDADRNLNSGGAVRGTDRRMSPPSASLAQPPTAAVGISAAPVQTERARTTERPAARRREMGERGDSRPQRTENRSVNRVQPAPAQVSPAPHNGLGNRFGNQERRQPIHSAPVARQPAPARVSAPASAPTPAAAPPRAAAPAAVQRAESDGRQNNGNASRGSEREGRREVQRAIR